MRIGPLTLFALTSSGNRDIATWHNTESLTWKWCLSRSSLNKGQKLGYHKFKQGIFFNFPILGAWRLQWQKEQFIVDLKNRQPEPQSLKVSATTPLQKDTPCSRNPSSK